MNFLGKELTVIVVTGASGQLGRHVIEGLLATDMAAELSKAAGKNIAFRGIPTDQHR